MTRATLNDLIEAARLQAQQNPPSAEALEAQRRSFAYGTARIENEAVTRDMIDHEADRFAQG